MGTGIFASTARFYIHDHLYSPAALTDCSGNVLERYEYDAYGNPTIWQGDFIREKNNTSNPYLFTGRRVDCLDSGSLKIQYNRNRYYDYHTGRWFTHDPLGITPNCRKPNEFRPLGQYKDTLNLYEMMNSNPVLGNDPWGLSGLLWKSHEACMSKKFRDILKDLIKMADSTTIWDHVLFGGGYPYGHCMWSCEMTKDKGEKYAEEMGEKKEDLDEAFADWADTISDSCWKKWSSKKREEVAAWVCSADQTSDRKDNAAGRDCATGESDSDLKVLPCWQCCAWVKDIARDTPEGDKERPYGPRCHGRYKKEVEKKLGRSVVVENPR